MINENLIKQFAHVQTNRLSGVLSVTDDDIKTRFYFEDGGLLLLDLGQDKELVMATYFVELYKIDSAMCSYAKTEYTEKGVLIADTLLKQQLVNQSEVEQVTRYMVEDVLCQIFDADNPASWEGDTDATDFDIDKTTVKLRIDIEMLLTMVQSRIAERTHVHTRMENWNITYSIRDDAPDTANLNEMERNILGVIDGRKSVKNIARSVRESNVNVGIFICSLETQGYVYKGNVKNETTALQPVAGQETDADEGSVFGDSEDAANAGPKKTITERIVRRISETFSKTATEQASNDAGIDGRAPQDFEVYTGSYVNSTQKASGLRRVVLIVVLVAAVGIGALVWSDIQDKNRQQAQRQELRDLITAQKWIDAEGVLLQAFTDAQGSPRSVKKLEVLITELHTSFTQKFAPIHTHLRNGDWQQAQKMLEAYPGAHSARDMKYVWTTTLNNKVTELRSQTDEKEQEIIDRESSLVQAIANRLESGNVASALALLKKTADTEYSNSVWSEIIKKSQLRIRSWRSSKMREIKKGIEGNNKSYAWLFEQIAGVSLTDLSATEKSTLGNYTAILTDRQGKLLQRLEEVPHLLRGGDYLTTAVLLEKLRANAMALSKEKRSLVDTFIDQNNMLQSQTEARRHDLETQLENAFFQMKTLRSTRDLLAHTVQSHENISFKEELMRLLATVDVIIAAATQQTLSGELKELEKSLDNTALVQVTLEKRCEWLSATIRMASAHLLTIHTLSKEGSIDDAIRSLNTFINEVHFSKTIAYTEALELQKSLQQRQEKTARLYKKFEAAILKEDGALVLELLPQLDIKKYPYVVSSTPSGAQIFLNGVDTGAVTPSLYPAMSNAERSDMHFEIKKEGYRTAALSPYNAEQSWRIRAVLQRKPIVEVDLKQSINSVPVVIDGVLWVSSNKSIWAIDAEGQTTEYKLENNASIIYAPATKIEGSIYVPTRNRTVQRINPTTAAVSSISVSLSTNHAISYYVSQVIMDTELLILVDAVNGAIHAIKESDGSVQWRVSDINGKAAAAPLLVEDTVLCSYRDGTCLAVSADNGDVVQRLKVHDPILHAWHEGTSIVGYTPTQKFTWNGTSIEYSDLLKNIIGCGPQIIKTKDNRIRTVNAEGRFDIELGKMTDSLTSAPILWNNHAVCPAGNKMHIIGEHSFTMTSAQEMLPPVLMDDILILVSEDGLIRFLKK